MYKDKQLHSLFDQLIREAVPLINPAIDKKWFKSNHEYPQVKHNSNGMPNIYSTKANAYYQITDLFRAFSRGKPDVDLEGLSSYKNLFDYLISHGKHKENAYPELLEEPNASDMFSTITKVYIENILERYYHLNKSNEYCAELYDSIYLQVENLMFAEDLFFDISLPILFIGFNFDEVLINENLVIRRISDEHHKARFGIRSYSPPISDSVISSATHEVVFKNYSIKKGNRFYNCPLGNENAYPIENFELFFNAIKIVTNLSSGFAQVLVYPNNWARHFLTDLPFLQGLSTRKYPYIFDDYYWNNTSFPILDTVQAQNIGNLFLKLLNNTNNKITIASKRLRSSYLRDNEDDSILDIIIALEILLSDNDKGEITHKLALRVAKLIAVHNNRYDAMQVFEAVKKIYAFRSSVVHGSTKANTKREITLHPAASPINTISLANDFLREVIKISVENPKYLSPKEIDSLLLN